jgi:hypothetical protein
MGTMPVSVGSSTVDAIAEVLHDSLGRPGGRKRPRSGAIARRNWPRDRAPPAAPLRLAFGTSRRVCSHRCDVRQAGREQNIGAGLLVGLEPANGVVKIGIAADEVLGARREHELHGQRADCGNGRLDPANGKIVVVDGPSRVA